MTRLPASSDRTAATPAFKDGLGTRFGTRVRVTDAGGDPVEHLQLIPELAAQESAIRDRVGRLINFRHARYVRLRGVDRGKTGTRPLVIAYDALEGHRLSTVLESLSKIALNVEVDVALQIVRDLLPAIGILHDSRKVTHGAIAPERLVYTSQQRLVIVDQGLGSALMRMNLPRKKLWEQFRIASPATTRAVFDEKMDVVQIGLVALALMLGRPLTDEEYPAQIKRVIFSVKETSSRIGSRPIGPELRRWLERATGIDEAQTFTTIKEAQDAFETVVAVDRYAPTAAAVKGFFLRYDELVAQATPAADEAAAPTGGSTVDVDSALSAMQMQVTIAPRRRPVADPPPAATEAVELKPPSRAKARVEAKAAPAVTADARPEPAATKPESVTFGRRKSDRLDALQALQDEMSAASGDIEQAGAAVAGDAAAKVTAARPDDSERLAREAAERARQEAETREQAEREGRALAEQVARDAAEQVAREAAERAAAERQARAASEREAVERGARQEAERQAHEASLRATRETAEREAAERAARDASAREETEREARKRLERESIEGAERRAREQVERDAAERAAHARREEETREREVRAAADKHEAVERARQEAGAEAVEKARQEAAGREATERQARELAEREARVNAERAQKEAAERAVAERAALEAAARAEKEAAVRATAERAAKESAERAERAERESAERAARAERDAAERAERALRESAAREATERQARELAEREARAAERALKEAAERAATEQVAREAAERAAREVADRAAAERAALEATQRADREAAEREAAQRAAREAKERAAREATERAAVERAAREAAEREAAHKAARELAEQAVLEAAEREATHRLALQAAELAVREAAERADVERAARQAAEQVAREASQRALADLAAQHADARGDYETAGRVAAERAARHHQEAAENERIAREMAQREAREAGERAQREAAERAAAERAAREHAARAEAEREARAVAEREARQASDRAERHAAERHAAERAAREAAALMEAERQARAAAEQAARDAAAREVASREAAERAAREAAELAADNEPRRRRKKKRPGGRTPEEADAVQPLPSSTEGPAAAPATFSATPEAPASPMVQWQPGQSVEVLPAWARGGASDAPASTPAEPEAVSYSPPPSSLGTESYAPPPAEPSASILAFKPQPDTWMHRAPQGQPGEQGESESRAVTPGTTTAPRRSFRINWARTLAASLLVALLEGVAFATAWWYVTPEQQGWLVVHTKPAGIQISVDGMVLGKTPFAHPLRPGRHTIELRYGTGTRVVPVEISAGVQTEQRLSWGNGFTTGQASISSSTAGAKVTIDGRLMGKTPLTVSDLLPGKHEVTVEGEKGSVSAMLMVEAGQTTELDVPVYAGWASVLSPVQLDILLDGKLIGSTEIEKLMLRPGKHMLELVNESLGYRGSVEVRVRPGATTSVSVVPKTPVTIDAPEGTELSINGENMGTLPNAGLQVPLGTAEFVMRYKDEERRQVVPVTMSAPVTVKFELATVVDR